jgi:hypothetical protein
MVRQRAVPAPHGRARLRALRKAARLLLAMLALTPLGVSGRADAATWSLQTAPVPTGAGESALNGVSCPTERSCVAVGEYSETLGKRFPLAMRWDGTRWALQTAPSPAGAQEAMFAGVSCVSESACSGVGVYVERSGKALPLAERWNGTEWQLQTPAVPAGASGAELLSVSCTASTACTAVGSYQELQTRPLIERWNGTSWSLQPSAEAIELEGVSCTTSTSCVAVGAQSSFLPFAEGWNGREWSAQSTPAVSGGLLKVSCSSSSACTAVGDRSTILRWNGTRWATQETPVSGNLASVACPAGSTCLAVGDKPGPSEATLTSSEIWNGTSWAGQETPNPAGSTYDVFEGISCSSTALCAAVGLYRSAGGTFQALVERYA